MRSPPILQPLAIFWAGALMGGAQVVVIRQGLAISGGDESVMALALATWLLSVALGSAVVSKLLHKYPPPNAECCRRPFAMVLSHLAVFSFLAPIALMMGAANLGWIPGALPGAGGLLAPLVLAILPAAFLGGCSFPLGCALLSERKSALARAYLLEASGTGAAGGAAALLFFPQMASLALPGALALVGFALSLSFFWPRPRLWMSLPLALSLVFLCQPALRQLDFSLTARLWPGQKIVDLAQTPYGLLEVHEWQGQISVYENGLPLASSQDVETSEERAHLFLAQHPAPQRVLWIGGSIGGSLSEALRHPMIRRIDVVELNPALFDLADRMGLDSLPRREPSSSESARLAFIRDDGRRFLSRSAPHVYDLICLNLPGPRSARLAKFYSVEAFELARRALAPGGVLVFSLESSEDYIGPDLAELLRTIKATLSAAFDRVEILPGSRAIFIAGDRLARPALSAASIALRLHERGIEPLYWDRYRLADRLSPSHAATLNAAMAESASPRLSRDAAPICFLQNQLFWAQQLRGGLVKYQRMLQRAITPLMIALLFLSYLLAVFMRLGHIKNRQAIGLPWAVAVVGFSGLTVEILTLIAYQTQYGSGYREVGMLMGLYMAGLASGAAAISKLPNAARRLFLAVQALWVALPLGLAFLTLGLAESLGAWGQMLFFLYLLTAGFLGGLHFPLAVSFTDTPSPRRAGKFYALDLTGAAAGALICVSVALPLWGLDRSAYLLAALNLPPLLLLFERCSAQPLEV